MEKTRCTIEWSADTQKVILAYDGQPIPLPGKYATPEAAVQIAYDYVKRVEGRDETAAFTWDF